MKQSIKDFDDFPLKIVDIEIDCSIKHYFQCFIDYKHRFGLFKDLSVLEYMNQYSFFNKDIQHDKPKGLDLRKVPKFFWDYGEQAPDNFSDWGLKVSHHYGINHYPPKPKLMQPKV